MYDRRSNLYPQFVRRGAVRELFAWPSLLHDIACRSACTLYSGCTQEEVERGGGCDRPTSPAALSLDMNEGKENHISRPDRCVIVVECMKVFLDLFTITQQSQLDTCSLLQLHIHPNMSLGFSPGFRSPSYYEDVNDEESP